MPIFIPLIILLSFPALEIYTLFHLADRIGWWLPLWLIFTTIAGIALIREEKLAFFARLILAVKNGQSPFSALLESGRFMLAGWLLIFPGVFSDLIAVVLLLLPRRRVRAPLPRADSRADNKVIEGTYRRED